MEKVKLGNSNLKVSQIGLGTMAFGRWISEEDSAAILDHAVNSGINLIDTADYYGPGQDEKPPYGDGTSETIIGNWLSQNPGVRSKIVLATKVGSNTNPVMSNPTLSREHIHQQIDSSLERLQTDHIDLYQAHLFDNNTPLAETLTTLSGLVDEGKIRYYGVSNYTEYQLTQALAIIKDRRLNPLTSLQNRYNILSKHNDHDVLKLAQRSHVGFLAYSPLARGVLTGKYLNGAMPSNSRAAQGEPLIQEYFNDADKAAVEQLKTISDQSGIPMSQLAFAGVLSIPGITTALLGASKVKYIDDAIKAAGLKLPQSVMSELKSL
ncbi:aldo/keto reductase [Lactobacillus sp. LC28-10]|uniref:Aldo/keto reductase n=1 Tax=Secundilactobacillus angelensis TaxID=2722706 RepID=A0ABX1L0R3_9LACO|nr:aldo/keto reductase [Secundilactobacillus angelensis]MCH5461591.1 aldo/keto reductase [Secundilactobacillus angelensis]NLR17886.1 aldo/keto reductase [Secundilactobacillus angelensis]